MQKFARIHLKVKTKTADKSDNTNTRNKSKDIDERRKIQTIPGQGKTIHTKEDLRKERKKILPTSLFQNAQGQSKKQVQRKQNNFRNRNNIKERPGWYPRSVMVKAVDCRIVVSEFELKLRCYVHFRTNTTGKGMNILILPAMG